MKSIKNELEKICPDCKSSKVGQIHYININNNEILDYFEPTTTEDVYKCFDCGEGIEYDKIKTREKKWKTKKE